MFKILDEVCTPTKGSEYSACIDLYAREDVVIGAGETAKVHLGVCIDDEKLKEVVIKDFGSNFRDADQKERFSFWFMSTHYLQLEPRSSLRAKGIQAGTGVIDLDFIPNCKIGKHIDSGTCSGFKKKNKQYDSHN